MQFLRYDVMFGKVVFVCDPPPEGAMSLFWACCARVLDIAPPTFSGLLRPVLFETLFALSGLSAPTLFGKLWLPRGAGHRQNILKYVFTPF